MNNEVKIMAAIESLDRKVSGIEEKMMEQFDKLTADVSGLKTDVSKISKVQSKHTEMLNMILTVLNSHEARVEKMEMVHFN